MTRKMRRLWSAAVVMAAPVIPAAAIPFTAGDLVVYRVGDGVSTLSNTGSAVFVDEYKPDGSFVQSVGLPTALSGGNNPLVASGTATSEGLITVSNDGSSILVTGYDRAIGGSGSLANTTSTAVPRVVGVVNTATGAINTTTALSDWASANNPRSAASPDGNGIYVTGAAGGIRYATLGATNSLLLSSPAAAANFRAISLTGNNIYVTTSSTSSGSTALEQLGSGLPTTAGQTLTFFPGIPSPTVASAYQFFLADLNPNVAGLDTVYYADDGTGAIEKYVLNGSGTWVFSGSATASAIRGLAGSVDGNGVHLWGATGAAGATNTSFLFSFTDTSGTNSISAGAAASTFATASLNEAFRGIAIIPQPTPEPSALALVATGIGASLLRQRRKPEGSKS